MLHSPTRTQLRQQDSTGNLDSENNDNTSLSQSQSRPIVTSGYNSQSNIEISATSVKLPQFWTNCPEAWFIHAEMHFATKGITQSRTKYEYIITALPQDVIMTVLDTIQNPNSTNPYEHLKNILIERHSISEHKKLDKILSDSQIGDRKPSEFYRSLALLAGTNFSTEILKEIWLRKLPKSLNVALTTSNLSDINETIKLADKLWEVLHNGEVNSIKGLSSESNLGLNKVIESLAQATSCMVEQFKSLSLEVSSIKKDLEENRYQPRYRQFNRNRSRSRGRSRNRDWLCRFHYRFGSQARNCEQPCSYKRSETEN